jgi:ABC-type multidrug transport system fused ATPase/permease subunit
MFKKQIDLVYRFCLPARLDKKETLKSSAMALLETFWNDILPIITVAILLNAVQNLNQKAVLDISLITTIIILVSFTFRYVYMRGWYWFSNRRFYALLENHYRATFLLKDNIAFESQGTGKIQSIIENGLSIWARFFNDSLWYVIRILSTVIVGIFVLQKMGIEYIIAFVFFLILTTTVYSYLRIKKYSIDLAHREIRNEYSANSVRTIMSRAEILFADNTEKEARKLYDLKMKEFRNGIQADKWGFWSVASASGLSLLLPFFGPVFFILYDPRGLTTETVAILVTFIVFSTKLSSMIWNFVYFIGQAMDSFPDIKKLWDFLDNTPDIVGYNTGDLFIHKRGDIKLTNTSFSYNENRHSVLQNLSITIAGGAKVAFVGKSGSGKTTIAKLIAGYMRPTSGDIIIDGQNLSEVSLRSYYACIGYLTQEPMVFDGTIRENLLYAVKDSNISEQVISEALEKAQCDFVLKAEKGLDTQIGEKGVRLSGGEKQRLAIAKLLLKNPEIVILDEPTSALDSFSEDAVTKAMNELFVGRTVIIIAHRLQTVKSADRIIVLDAGKIVEEGTHTELVQSGGTYARMLEMQSGF